VSSDADYMSLEISADWVSYTWLNVFLPYTVNDNKWSEWTLDNNSDPNDNTTLSWTYAELYSSIPTSYLTNNFKIRFKWTTNGSDNNYNGCLVDNIKIEWHNPSYGYKDGTSMATPHVAWLASLAWSSSPSLTYAQIRNIIINSGDALASLSWKTVSGKRINAQNVLQALWYSSNSGANWSQIYTAMWATLSWQWIQNNLNNVTNNTVNNFLWLYFAKMSWSSELWRIIFATWLNLTDTGTQNFLSWDLPTSIWMSQWQIWFNPWTWFIWKNATLKMNLPYNFSSILGSINSWSFIVRDGSGGAVTWNSMITSVYSWTCVWMWDYACPLYIDVAHFTQFDLKPLLTNVVISSNNSNTSYAKSWHIVTLSFTGSETLTWISISINWSGYSYTWNGIYFTSTFTVTWWTAETWIIFSINYQDLNGNTWNTVTTTTNSSSVKVDNTPPSITVTSANTTSSATITLQWTWSDINWISQIYVSGSLATGTWSWSKTSVWLVWWSNTINLSGIDLAWNITTTTFNITRLPVVSSVISQVLSWTSAIVSFNSDFISSWYIIYGTSTLNNIFTWTLSASHSMALNGLTHNTTYYYRAYAKINWSTWDVSATGSFILPYVIPTTWTSNITTTWTADLWWWASTSFTNSWMLRLYTSWATSTWNYFEISLNWLWVLSDSGAWNGLINWPIQTSFIWTAPSYTDYTHQSWLTFKIWVDNIAITFSWKQATVKILVWTTYDGKSLRVYRSSNWTTYSRIDNCTVSAGYCTFSTDTFSYFTMMSPSVAWGWWWGGWGWWNTTVDVPTCKLSDVICIDWYYEIDGNVDCEWWYLWDACYDDTVNNNNTDEWDISNSPFNTELNDAYQYAYQIWITTMSTIQKANMTWTLQRSHLAKMIVNYATEVLSKQADTTKSCNFSDISDQSTELKWYIKTACQMWLMWVGLKTFYPKNKVTRAEFGTILSRALRWNGSDQSWWNYYVKHLQALKYAWVMTQISIPSIIEIRWYVMLMLMRAKDKQ
jgi:hypothetical protein